MTGTEELTLKPGEAPVAGDKIWNFIGRLVEARKDLARAGRFELREDVMVPQIIHLKHAGAVLSPYVAGVSNPQVSRSGGNRFAELKLEEVVVGR